MGILLVSFFSFLFARALLIYYHDYHPLGRITSISSLSPHSFMPLLCGIRMPHYEVNDMYCPRESMASHLTSCGRDGNCGWTPDETYSSCSTLARESSDGSDNMNSSEEE